MVEVQISDILMGLQGKLPDINKDIAIKQDYDPDACPPDFQMGIAHGYSKKVYKSDPNADPEKQALCPCCGLIMNKDQLEIHCELEDLYHLGCGFALYFRFIKYCIVILLIILVVSGLYGIISNKFGEDCQPNGDRPFDAYCTEGMILTFSIANKRDAEGAIKAQLALNFVAMVLVMVFLHYVRYQSRLAATDAEDRTVTPGDFAVQFKRVPSTTTDEEFKSWLEGMATEKQAVQVHKIVRSYDIREYVVLRKRKEELKTQREMATDPEQLRIIDDEVESVKQKLGKFKTGGLEYAEAVYVSFEQADQADFIRKKFIKSPAKQAFHFLIAPFYSTFDKINGKRVKAKRAPEPTDILWENFGYTPREKFQKRLITNSATILLILVSFALITILCWAQIHAPTLLGEHVYILRLLSLLGSLFIYVINTLLSMTLRFLADYEKHTTFTGYHTGLSGKLCMAMFVNTAFTTLFAKIILAGEYSDSTNFGDYLRDVNFYNTSGVLENILYVVLTGALLSPFMVIFDPFHFYKLFQQKREIKKGEKSLKTQSEIHTLFEGSYFDLSYKYAILVKSMLLTAFYAPALPTVLLITIFGLVLSYWADKYVFLRRAVLPNAINDNLTRVMTEYLEWMPFTYAVGNLMFTLILQNSDGDVTYDSAGLGLMWATIILSLVNILLPMGYVNERLFPIKDDVTETLNFHQARLHFGADYDIQNPITRKHALKEYIELTRSKGGLPTEGTTMFLQSMAKDILNLVNLQKEGEEGKGKAGVDLDFLDDYAEKVAEKPLKQHNEDFAKEDTAAIQGVLDEHQVGYGDFMTQLGSLLKKTVGDKNPEGEGVKDQDDEKTGLLQQ